MSFNKLFILLIFAAALSSCGSTKQAANDSKVKPVAKKGKQLTEEEQINLKFLFVNANKEKMLGNKVKAAELFAQCIRIDGANDASMFELAKIYLEEKKLNDALFFARSASQVDPSNVWYRVFLGDLLMTMKKSDEGENVYASLFKDYPRNIEYAFKYASVLLYNGKLQEAIKVYDKVELEIGVTPDLTIEKERIWLRLGKIDKAAAEVERLIAKNPSDLKSYSLLVELYQSNDMPEKSLEVIERMQKFNDKSPYVYLALAEYYSITNQKQKSFEQLKLAFGSNELEHNIKIKIISSYLPVAQGNPEMLQQGIDLSKILADTHPTDAISLAIYGDFLMLKEDYAAASEQYLLSAAIDNKNLIVWHQLLICQSQLNDNAGMLVSSTEALSVFPDQSVLYLFNGVALAADKQMEQAVKALLAGSKLVVDDDSQLKEFYTRLADNYNTLKDYDESDKYFEKALKLDPMDPLVLNNYSYYLSLRKANLEKAETMSKLSNDLRPDQPSYLDTYGWILYVMGNYTGAKEWLQKALDAGGSGNGTILEHMGDTLFKLGETTQALDYWNRAKQAGDASEKIEMKIRDKKLYE